jgi:hypothetical protein
VGRDGRVIDLHVLTGREGGRRRGRERCMWGGRVVLRGDDARGKTAVWY